MSEQGGGGVRVGLPSDARSAERRVHLYIDLGQRQTPDSLSRLFGDISNVVTLPVYRPAALKRPLPRGMGELVRKSATVNALVADARKRLNRGESPESVVGRYIFNAKPPVGRERIRRDSKAVTVISAQYQNPAWMELAFNSSVIGAALLGLKMARDWRNTRRLNAARAAEAEAEAKQAVTRATVAELRADSLKWAVEELQREGDVKSVVRLVMGLNDDTLRSIDRLADKQLVVEEDPELLPPRS